MCQWAGSLRPYEENKAADNETRHRDERGYEALRFAWGLDLALGKKITGPSVRSCYENEAFPYIVVSARAWD